MIDRATLPQVLNALQTVQPDAPALTWYDANGQVQRFSYGELLRQIEAMACWFVAELGVERGDRVVVLSRNCPEAFVTHLALMSIGAVTVPVNNVESPRVLQLIIDQVHPRALVSGFDVAADIQAAQEKMIPLPRLPLASDRHPGWPMQAVLPDDPAVILFTSGTTSAPKGVCLSHYNLLVNAEGLTRTHRLAEHRVHMCILPLFHANAFGFSMVGSLYAGNHVVLCSGLPGADIWPILRDEHVDIVSLVPEIIRVLCRIPAPKGTLPDLKYVVSAAAPLPKKVAAEFMDKTGISIHQGYGLSECVNFAATLPWDISAPDLERALGHWGVPSIGPALYGCDMDILRADGTSAQAEEEGEIAISGHTVMLGYWDAEAATEMALNGGQLRTGDLGFFAWINGERYFFVTGRKKEIVIRYGENLSPLAIESELEALRGIGRYAVAGFVNEMAGEEIGLYVLARRTPDNEKRALDIARACPVRYRPRVIVFGTDPIPETPTGKVKRSLLAQRFRNYANRSFGSDPVLGT
ncbi:hypothetical protein WJ16_32110 [Burkholderia metallica]|nr:hypothetical protein WJ16_32110 [Burkholderia metallica]